METAEAYESVSLEKHLTLLEQLKTSMDEVAELTALLAEEKAKNARLISFVNTLFNTWKEFTDSFLAAHNTKEENYDGNQEQYKQVGAPSDS